MPVMPENKSERLAALADQCVQCGLCLPACPTYALDGNEAESPRGRIAIAAALARGAAPVSDELRKPLDHCLGCLSCERVCPAQVRFGDLLVETRALLGPAPRRPRVLLALTKRPAWLRTIRRLAGWAWLPHWQARLSRWLPRHSAWRAAMAMMAVPRQAESAPTHFASSPTLARVALFVGCVASVEDTAAQQAAIVLLEAAGHPVTRLPASCCGALDAHGGLADAAVRAMQRVRDAWQASGASMLVTVTPGCIGQLRTALPGVPVTDPYALLAAQAGRFQFDPLPLHVALHLPCTQVNVARSDEALRSLLRRVPALEIVPLPPGCCGAAGSHMLEFPERAASLRAPVLEAMNALAPQALLSSNIGCRLHLAAGLAEQDRAVPTLHPLVLLAQQLAHGSPS
ncbi:glycolate oxidase iron-sulfur subunit [Frateuria terrea]|uniref:Glycolate oxidase iron-sulfur subunit n=2 Tax=Frateuria terrea TaxID=529704 RepID=A0A1H6RXE2_9GAMM|nr:glycolate oxidase iron-sulfur subunit [Frateuria terrea]SFP22209.1 glycolate oxidase iron-sulfur subunit [Frateuria terrea]